LAAIFYRVVEIIGANDTFEDVLFFIARKRVKFLGISIFSFSK
jgi:hypothetical protein